MKSKAGLGLGFVLVLGVVLGWSVAARSGEQATRFSIIVTSTAAGATLRCDLGCNWKELSFGCDGKVPCTAKVDEHGVGGAEDAGSK